MKITNYSDVMPLDMTPRPAIGAPTTSSKAMNPLIDSMEEVALKFSENVERHSKSLDERSIREPGRSPRVERVEKLVELYRLLDQGDKPNLEQQARRMQALLHQQPSMQAALVQGENDPARTEILLQQALHLSTAEGRVADSETTRGVIDELRKLYGDKIRAGFNTAGAIALFTQDPQQRALMRQIYYKAIVGQQPLASLFELLLEHLSEQQIARGLRTLQKALSDDIASLAPSLSGIALGSMLRGLSACGQLSNLLNACHSLLERLPLRSQQSTLTPLAMSKRVLRFCANGVFARDLTLLTDDVVGYEPKLHPFFLNGFYSLLQNLPLLLWKDVKTRQGGMRLLNRMMEELARQERLVTVFPSNEQAS